MGMVISALDARCPLPHAPASLVPVDGEDQEIASLRTALTLLWDWQAKYTQELVPDGLCERILGLLKGTPASLQPVPDADVVAALRRTLGALVWCWDHAEYGAGVSDGELADIQSDIDHARAVLASLDAGEVLEGDPS